MPRGFHKTQALGYLGKDPEVRYTGAGVAVASFSIAVSEEWKDADGNKQERTEWYNCVVWRKLAEICGEWLKKGSRVFVEGRMKTESWDDKNTGTKHYQQKLHVDHLVMLSQKTDGGYEAEVVVPTTSPSPAGRIEDDLPF